MSGGVEIFYKIHPMIKENNFSVVLLDSKTEAAYLTFTKRNKLFLWYSSLTYKIFFEKYLNLRSQYILVLQDQMIVGCLPLFFSPHTQYGTVINSLPYYGSNGAFLFDEKLTVDEKLKVGNCLLKELNQIIMDENISAVTLVTNPFEDFSNDFLEKNFSADYTDFRHGQLTPLPSNTGELMDVFQNPRPRNIRKAIKSDIKVRTGTSKKDFKFLVQTHQQNMLKIGGKFKDNRFFEMVQKGDAGNTYKLYVAELDGNPVSALLLFYFNHTVEYFTPCTLDDYRNLQPSSLLIYEAMKDAIEEGFRHWNWGGTWASQTGVFDFKRKWGAIDKNYHYHTRLLNKELLSLTPDEINQAYPHFYTVPYNQLKAEL